MWGQSLPWHKVLNAVVYISEGIKEDASILCYSEFCIYSLNKVLSDERLGAKLRVTENQCVLFDSFTYI